MGMASYQAVQPQFAMPAPQMSYAGGQAAPMGSYYGLVPGSAATVRHAGTSDVLCRRTGSAHGIVLWPRTRQCSHSSPCRHLRCPMPADR